MSTDNRRTLCVIVAENQWLLLWQQKYLIFFLAMVLTQVIIKPKLRLVRYIAGFIKILEMNFLWVCIVVGRNVQTAIQTYGKLTWF